MSRQPQAEDLYAIKLADEPQISPDGDRVAYVVVEIDRPTYEYRRSIWLVPAGGGEARRFTGGPNDTAPRWSGDGRWLAFVRAPSGEVKPKDEQEREQGVGKPQVWVLPADGGEARQLTFHRNGAGDPAWTPDGSALVYSAGVGEPDDREADDAALHDRKVPAVRTLDRLRFRFDGKGWTYEHRWHLFGVPRAGGPTRQLTDGDWDDESPAVSPDGSRIAFTSDRTQDRWTWPGSDVWVLDRQSGAVRRLTDETVTCGPPAWSPDGRTIAFTAGKRRHSDGHVDLYVVPSSGDAPARTLSADFAPTCADRCIDDQRAGHGGAQVYWSADGREITFAASSRGSTHLYAIPAAGGPPRRLTQGDRRIFAFSLDRRASTLAFASSDPATPGDVYAGDRRLTDLNREWLAEVALARPQEFAFEGPDGWPLQGWILRPADDDGSPAPTILQIHGGPHAMYGWSFFFEFQLLAARGYTIVYTNPRGSTGYGRAFSGAVINDWGGKDYQDIMVGLDAAIRRGGIDPDRLGVAGGSYGGYMTNWVVGHTDRFKAAITMRCVSNLATMFGTSDIGWHFNVDQMNAVPWKDLDRLMERSPITYVENIRTPLLILHSDSDLRCPISEGEQMFTALKFLGREVKMVRFEGQSHDLSRSGHPRSRVIRLHQILDWFSAHIAAGAAGLAAVRKPAASALGVP